MILVGGSLIFVLILIGFHCFLMANNLTTHEHLKKLYREIGSPYDKKSICLNLKTAFCFKSPPNLLKFMMKIDRVKTNAKKILPADPSLFET